MKAEPQAMTIYRHRAGAPASRRPRQIGILSRFERISAYVCLNLGARLEVWNPSCDGKIGRALTRRCQARILKSCEVATIRLAYEMLDAGNEGSKCCFQGATRSGAGATEPEPSPLADSLDPLPFEAERAGTWSTEGGRSRLRRKRAGEDQVSPSTWFGNGPGNVPGMSQASIRCICSRAACRGASSGCQRRLGTCSVPEVGQGRRRGSRPRCWRKPKISSSGPGPGAFRPNRAASPGK